jgi:hypothetical protein
LEQASHTYSEWALSDWHQQIPKSTIVYAFYTDVACLLSYATPGRQKRDLREEYVERGIREGEAAMIIANWYPNAKGAEGLG